VFEIGSSLCAAREHQKLELDDVERATRIRTKFLQALEEERFDVLPGTAYVKGFLRTYADFLELDGPRFVEEFNERFAPSEPFETAPLVRVRRRQRLLDVRVAVLLLAVGVGLFSWRLASGGKHRSAPAPPATTRVRATTTTKTTPPPPSLGRVVLVATVHGKRLAPPDNDREHRRHASLTTLALAGDTMLGRAVAERLMDDPDHVLFAPELVEIVHEADLFLLNLESAGCSR
jgi:cytoskeletal protein RodZ